MVIQPNGEGGQRFRSRRLENRISLFLYSLARTLLLANME